jgi:hypothetical protein
VSSFELRTDPGLLIQVPEVVHVGQPFSVKVSNLPRTSGRVDFLVGTTPVGSVFVTGSTVSINVTAWHSSETEITATWVDYEQGSEFRTAVRVQLHF